MHRLALAVAGIVLIGGCSTASSGPPSPAAGGSASPAPPTAAAESPAPTAITPSSSSPTTAAECVPPPTNDALAPLTLTDGRCITEVRDTVLSFEPGDGWTGAKTDVFTVLALDRPETTRLRIYRYGGSVVPHYCQDPPPWVPMSAGADIVAWLETQPGLAVVPIGRSVGANPAWQLDITAVAPQPCSPGKLGLASLWTIDGVDPLLPETLDEGAQIRAYLVEAGEGILIFVAIAPPETFRSFTDRAEQIFSSLRIEGSTS